MNIWIAEKDLMQHCYHLEKLFYSELNLENITAKYYHHAQNVWEVFGINNLA